MTTVAEVSAAEVGVSHPGGSFDKDDNVYENVLLIGVDMDKLVALCDALLFYCQVARLRTRPVTITEAEGCVTLKWSTYAPAAFRKSRMLELIVGARQIDYLTVQESVGACTLVNEGVAGNR